MSPLAAAGGDFLVFVLRCGDVSAAIPNSPDYYGTCWGGQRVGCEIAIKRKNPRNFDSYEGNCWLLAETYQFLQFLPHRGDVDRRYVASSGYFSSIALGK